MTFNHSLLLRKLIKALTLAIVGSHFATVATAGSTDIANVPMAVSNLVTPNVLVIYDNSQSMDAYMNGTLVSGSDPNTRGNIGRQVMRNSITTYRNAFNWGLMSYEMRTAPSLYNTYAYYLGSNAGMVFTDDCVGYIGTVPPTQGVSATNGNRRCVANPQPFLGGNFVTFDKTGDDADIQDVFYTSGVYSRLWGLTSGATPSTAYTLYTSHNTINSWAAASFTGSLGAVSFTPTDAGYLSVNPPMTRQLYVPRGWGYNADITGAGKLEEKIDADSTTHYNTLQSKLANETNGATTEIKNGAVFTPLRGSLQSAQTYYSAGLSGNPVPVQFSCQQNFVMLVTDGLPTGDTSGNLYSAADRTNTCSWSTTTNTCTAGMFGTAATQAINAAKALRTTTVSGKTSTSKDGNGAVTGKFDVQTYVVALGDTVANASALSVMNAMAFNGGTDKAIQAADATAFKNAITQISDDITAKVGSAAAVAVANAQVTANDNASYASSYNSGTWSGDINSNAINLSTGLPSSVSLWVSGSASTQLDARSLASRFIVTSVDTAGGIGGVQFQPATALTATKLSAAQQLLLNTPSMLDGTSVLAYLRGDRTGEVASGAYRPRSHVLGDIINSEPLVVPAPSNSYTDTGYAAFKSSNATRTRMLLQGANDGMLHAFVAATGAESWAYVPNLLMPSLNNLSMKTGFNHKYYVDGTPEFGDVDFLNIDGVSTGGDWRTIVVGGLGKGGRGFYALDVSSPTASSEVDAKNKVLWEFPNSITSATVRTTATLNMGFSFGKPLIVKTAAKGWVVVVSSGYNNGTNSGDSGGDGLGHLYIINPKTGELIKDIPTVGCGTNTVSTPCGLAHISASTDSNKLVDYVYGGDLNGNVWRFNLTGASVAGWNVSKFTTLVDGSGTVQPISTAPELTNKSGVRTVIVGTGLYLGNTDIPGFVGSNSASTQTQSLYALRDELTALPAALRSNLQLQTVSSGGTTGTVAITQVDYAVKKGWYVDLRQTGERINTKPASINNTIVWTSNLPSSTKCDPGGSSRIYAIDITAGYSMWASLGNVLASRPVVIVLPSGSPIALTRLSDATTVATKLPPPPTLPIPTVKRLSWRQIFR